MTDAAAAKSGRKPKVRYYRFRNALREKASGGGGGSGPGAIAEEALEAAEAEFVKMAEDYPDWVQAHLRRLYEMHGAALIHPSCATSSSRNCATPRTT